MINGDGNYGNTGNDDDGNDNDDNYNNNMIMMLMIIQGFLWCTKILTPFLHPMTTKGDNDVPPKFSNTSALLSQCL